MNTNQHEPATLKEAWAEYQANIYPQGITKVQQVECSQAFYAGALIMFHLMSGITALPLTEDEQANKLETVRQEAMNFIKHQVETVLQKQGERN